MRNNHQIEAMYYLSPLQQGLLFHRLADAKKLQGFERRYAFELSCRLLRLANAHGTATIGHRDVDGGILLVVFFFPRARLVVYT